MRADRPLKREGTADDIAEAALYLAGDRSRYVTGTVLPVDGGTVAGKVTRRRSEQERLNQSLDLTRGGALTEPDDHREGRAQRAGQHHPGGDPDRRRAAVRRTRGVRRLQSAGQRGCRARATTRLSATTSAPKPIWCGPSRSGIGCRSSACGKTWSTETLRPATAGDMRSWVACLVRPLTDHLAALGNPTLVRALRRPSDDRSRLLQHRRQRRARHLNRWCR